MCLIIASLNPGGNPGGLRIWANREEEFSRPTQDLHEWETTPRILAGKDLLRGGTWCAVNEYGVFAGLTNGHSERRKPRSRGELPLMLTKHATAKDALKVFEDINSDQYGPCQFFVGDNESLFYVNMLDGLSSPVQLKEGTLYVLGNEPLGEPTLREHNVRTLMAEGDTRLSELLEHPSICVYGDHFGTRSSFELIPDEQGHILVSCKDTPESAWRTVLLKRASRIAS